MPSYDNLTIGVINTLFMNGVCMQSPCRESLISTVVSLVRLLQHVTCEMCLGRYLLPA